MRIDKRRLTTAVAKHVLNPIVTIGVDTGLLRGWAIIETTGRKSGMPRRTAVGNGLQGDTGLAVPRTDAPTHAPAPALAT